MRVLPASVQRAILSLVDRMEGELSATDFDSRAVASLQVRELHICPVLSFAAGSLLQLQPYDLPAAFARCYIPGQAWLQQ